jgi:exoribonuclease-2
VDVEIVPSWVRVQRLTYSEVNGRLGEAPFDRFLEMARLFRARREEGGSASIELPEVQVRVNHGRVEIRPLPRLESRQLVTEAMLMAGEAVARFALEREIPIPFAQQPPPERPEKPQDLAAMYAYRRQMRPSQLSTVAGPHAGLGLELYTRATSPLRRYSDLLVHQQLRAFLRTGAPLEAAQLAERIAVAETAGATVRRAERMSNVHWKLVYLTQNPQWQGHGVVVELNDARSTLVIPDLAMETKMRLRDGASLNDRKKLAVREIELPELTVWFKVRK